MAISTEDVFIFLAMSTGTNCCLYALTQLRMIDDHRNGIVFCLELMWKCSLIIPSNGKREYYLWQVDFAGCVNRRTVIPYVDI